MSVLVKGMKMPQEQPLRMVLNPNGQLFVDHGAYFDEYEAVEVPTPHGRLIDEGELKEWIETWFVMHRGYHPYSRSNLIPSTEIVDILDRLPAIIEAEEGE